MNKLITLFTALLLIGFTMQAGESTEKMAMKAASENLSTWLEKIPAGQEKNYGFNSRAEFKSCQVGKPYHVVTFTKEFYQTQNANESKYIQFQHEWRVPVKVGGQNRILLTVIEKDGKFEVVDMGASVLAEDLQQHADKTDKDNYLLRVYPLAVDFLVTTTKENFKDAKYTALTSAKKTFKTPEPNGGVLNMTTVMHMVKKQFDETKPGQQ